MDTLKGIIYVLRVSGAFIDNYSKQLLICMKKVYSFLCLFVALSLSLPVIAQNMRYQQNIKGGFAMTANSLMAGSLAYANTAGGTTMSSYADLVLPPGSTIVKAFLYVERYAGGSITTAKFRVPGGSYITYTTASAGFIGNPGNGAYQQFIVDVTPVMPASNAYVTTVTTGGNAAGVGRYAVADANATINNGYGWSLYVVYTNPASRYRNVSVFDAALRYSSSTGSTSFLINNIVVPSSGPISANLGVTGCWGGVNSSGGNGGYADFISFGKDGGSYTDLTDPYMNTTNDIFNSSVAKAANNNVSTDGGPAMSGNFTARNPYAYTAYGNPNWSSVDYDADIIDASGILPNSTTPISVRITQSSPYSDVLGSGAYALSVDIAAAVLTKSVAPNRICDGDTATYFFKITNKELGALAQSGIAFTDNMPSGLRAIPGSGTITGGSGGTVTATATAISVSGLSLAINDSAIVAVKVTNVAGQTNPSCSANPVAFTNGFNNISGISNNLVNSITPQCLEVMSKQTPTFTQVGPYCQGAVIPALPTTSNNGITGSWSPAINNTATTTYTFTPAPGQCGTATTMTVVVNAGTLPVFSQVGPYCAGASIPALPPTSNNGISGTWSPAINNTATTTYTFTPTPVTGQCYLPTTMTITINPNIMPSFTQAGPYCAGASIPALPTTSNNGVSGTWSPAINNTTTTTYTFTPTPVTGQCYLPTTMTITINPNITPSFTQAGPYCAGASIPALPTTSNNGISGTWSPAINNATTMTYTFTPTPVTGQCYLPATMTITINPNITPSFTQAGPYCTGTAIPTLPTTSNNGISGTWSPAINNTATTTYTFSPSSGQCAVPANMTVTVNDRIHNTVNVTICQGKTYSFNGVTYTTSQSGLKDTFTTAGCDSIVTLNLNVTPYPTGTDVKTICQGQSYSFNGVTYTTANNTAKQWCNVYHGEQYG